MEMLDSWNRSDLKDIDSLNRVPTKKEVFNAINLMDSVVTEDDYN